MLTQENTQLKNQLREKEAVLQDAKIKGEKGQKAEQDSLTILNAQLGTIQKNSFHQRESKSN